MYSTGPVALQERRADSLRYAGLPKGDHSVLVEGLGTFAPMGSYAHDSPGGLGGDEEVSRHAPDYRTVHLVSSFGGRNDLCQSSFHLTNDLGAHAPLSILRLGSCK